MSRILKVEEINDILDDLQRFESSIESYCSNFNDMVNKFNANEIVQSFYASGNFGKLKEEQLFSLKNYIEKYYNIIKGETDGLIPATKEALLSQKELLSSNRAASVASNNVNESNIDSSNKFVGRMDVK